MPRDVLTHLRYVDDALAQISEATSLDSSDEHGSLRCAVEQDFRVRTLIARLAADAGPMRMLYLQILFQGFQNMRAALAQGDLEQLRAEASHVRRLPDLIADGETEPWPYARLDRRAYEKQSAPGYAERFVGLWAELRKRLANLRMGKSYDTALAADAH